MSAAWRVEWVGLMDAMTFSYILESQETGAQVADHRTRLVRAIAAL